MAEDDQKPQENPYMKMMQENQPQQATTPPAATTAPQPSTMQTIGQGALDFGKGVVKGGINTLTGIGSGEHALFPQALRNTSYGKNFEAGLNAMRGVSTPHGTMQNIGHGVEQAAEFMIPGGAEEKLASMAPKVIQPLARIGASALGAGAVNKAQGGSFGAGAAMGGAGSAIGQGMKAAAPLIAESALGIPKAARAFGKTPGKAILEETGNAIRPETIASNARERMGQLTPELESKYAASPNAVSLQPARQYISDQMARAEQENAEGLHGQLNRMGNTLAERFGTKQAIPQDVPALEGLNLKRGFGEEHTNWNPELRDRAVAAGRKTYGLLDEQLDKAVPEGAGLNQRISSLIPVAQRAESVGRNASTLQRGLGRFGAHTGALAIGGAGAYEGGKRGGIPGAIAGGLTGVLAPELIASPEGQMLAARALNRAGGLRGVVGTAAQLSKRKEDENQ